MVLGSGVRLTRMVVLALAASLIATACSSASTTSSAGTKQILIIGVFHADLGNSYAAVLVNGARAAEKDYSSYGAKLEFVGPPAFDLVAMRNLIDAAIAKSPQALLVSLPDDNAIGPEIQKAVSKGIPVFVYNSGISSYAKYGALVYIGVDETNSGRAVGARLASLGAKNVACFNHEVGNVSLDQRCAGILESMQKAGGTSKVYVAKERDPAFTEGAVTAALQHDPTIDAIVSGGFGDDTVIFNKVLTKLNKVGSVKVAIFDVSPPRVQGVKDGWVSVLSSQQQYMQGYLAVELATFYVKYGLLPGNGVIQTGPLLIDKSNLDRVVSGAGTVF